MPVGRPENRHQAAEVGAFLLEDILHWALARKQPDRQALFVVDEFSKLSDRPGAAVDLVEQARSFKVAVVLTAQSWASLGPEDTIRNRLAGTVGTVIANQLKQSDEIASLAGTEWASSGLNRRACSINGPRQPTSRKPLRRPLGRRPPPPPRRRVHHPQRPSPQAPDPAPLDAIGSVRGARWQG